MRLKIGPPPHDGTFDPTRDGWTLVRLPSPCWLQVAAFPIGTLAAALLYYGWTMLPPDRISRTWPSWGQVLGMGRGSVLISIPLSLGLTFLLVVVVHELLHSVGHPQLGLSQRTWVGFWPTRLLFYAAYLGPIGKSRYLVLGLLPLLGISLVPLLFCWLLTSELRYGGPLIFASVLNGLFSGGDLLMTLILFRQVPRGAILRDHGWDIYWKSAA